MTKLFYGWLFSVAQSLWLKKSSTKPLLALILYLYWLLLHHFPVVYSAYRFIIIVKKTLNVPRPALLYRFKNYWLFLTCILSKSGPCWTQWIGWRDYSPGGRHGNNSGLRRNLYPIIMRFLKLQHPYFPSFFS